MVERAGNKSAHDSAMIQFGAKLEVRLDGASWARKTKRLEQGGHTMGYGTQGWQTGGHTTPHHVPKPKVI